MEVAAGGTGGHPVTPGDSSAGSRSWLNIALYALALLLACVCVAGGMITYRTYEDRAEAKIEQQRYGEVLASASAEAEAFINIRYDDAQASIDRVASGATGEFRQQYVESVDAVIRLLEDNKSVMDGEVVWAGVVDLDQDSATVIAATSGTVANVTTGNEPVARNFRLQLDLELVEGQWLTNNLEFVG
ncbi:MAG: hypothetical protein WKF72_07670 [Nocardioidaceae bacterium]